MSTAEKGGLIFGRIWYTLGIFSFDVSCFTTQTLSLMYPDYTGKAQPHPWTFFSMLIHLPHTHFVLFTVANIQKYLLNTEKESFHMDDDASSLETWKYTRSTLFPVIYDLFLGRNLREDTENTTR